MTKKMKPIFYVLVLVLGFSFFSPFANKAEAKVYWDGAELKPGQIGRLTVLKDTELYQLVSETDDEVNLKQVRTLKKGSQFRIYAFNYGMLSVGGGYYVDRDKRVSYQTPTKAKLAQVVQEQRAASTGPLFGFPTSATYQGYTIKAGMTKSQVIQLLGKPNEIKEPLGGTEEVRNTLRQAYGDATFNLMDIEQWTYMDQNEQKTIAIIFNYKEAVSEIFTYAW